MRPLKVLLPVEEAMAMLMEAVRPVAQTERVGLLEACGRVLAEDTVASFDVPPFDRAAMDGYAVIAADAVTAPVTLSCVEVLYAGSLPSVTLTPGTCSEIATGAPLPPGADAVVMVEKTTKQEGGGSAQICIAETVRQGQHVTRRGADMREGEMVLTVGTVLTPARVGALAALGRTDACVYRRPRVAIGATGNEVVRPGEVAGAGQIYDVNSFSLHALFTSLGCEVTLLAPAVDDVEVIKARIREGLGADLVVLTGGSSVGERDVLQDAFAELGEILFHGVAIKPGKPTMLARIEGVPVVGMPGYPTSCLSNGYLFLAPAVDRIARRPEARRPAVRARLLEDIASAADKFQVYTVRLADGAAAAAFKESGVITSMSRADGFVTIPVGVDRLTAGQEVEVTLL